MQISGSCDGDPALGPELAQSGRIEELARRLPFTAADKTSPQQVEKVARDFVSVLYGAVVREMLNSIPREDGGDEEGEEDGDMAADSDSDPVAEGVRDFMTMFMPQALASNKNDPLVKYVEGQLSAKSGEKVNEQI